VGNDEEAAGIEDNKVAVLVLGDDQTTSRSSSSSSWTPPSSLGCLSRPRKRKKNDRWFAYPVGEVLE
jgi:hypothetical protein